MPFTQDSPDSILSPLANQLIESGYISLPELQRALLEQQHSQEPLTEIIAKITGKSLPSDLMRQYQQNYLFKLKILHGVESFDPTEVEIPWENIKSLMSSMIPLEVCQRLQVLPLQIKPEQPNCLQMVMVNPSHRSTLDTLKTILHRKNLHLERKVIAPKDFEMLIAQCSQAEKADSFSPEQVTMIEDILPENTVENNADQAPVITLVNKLLIKALEHQATEIHLEHQNDCLSVRVRVDGIMRSLFNPLPKSVAQAVISRLEIVVNLYTNQSQKSQKGRFDRRYENRRVDFILQTLPSISGEKAIIRVVDSQSPPLSLGDLISHEPTRYTIESLMRRQAGLILLTAPQNFGSATTWYSLLRERALGGNLNITSLEMDLERIIPNVTQIEINESEGVTYQGIFDSFLRQDVDIIAVDQIPNLEVGKAIIEMALTGHLVLTTLPVNSPLVGIVHLNKMGINPALVAEALLGVVNQRLLRCLCPLCRLSYNPSAEILSKFGLPTTHRKPITFYKAHQLSPAEQETAKAKGQLCSNCQGFGYQGQVGVYEVLKITPPLKAQIAKDAPRPSLENIALQEGWETLLTYALDLVYQGTTSLEEVELVLADYLPENLAPSPAPEVLANTEKLFAKFQEIESLALILTEKMQKFKQELKSDRLEEVEPQVAHFSEQDLDLAKQTMINETIMYEELNDPGDWEQLKREFDASKETMISELEELDEEQEYWGVSSVPDPWNH